MSWYWLRFFSFCSSSTVLENNLYAFRHALLYSHDQGLSEVAVHSAFDKPGGAKKALLAMIIDNLDADGDGQIGDQEVMSKQKMVAKYKSSRNVGGAVSVATNPLNGEQ